MKEKSGIALIVLILIVVAVGFVIAFGVKYVKEYVYNQGKEDIKATMLAIQSVTRNVKNKHLVDEENNGLIGEKLELENLSNTEVLEEEREENTENENNLEDDKNNTGEENIKKEYILPDELKEILLNLEDAELYVLSKEDLENHGIKDVNVSETEFYVVDYNAEEVYYSLGIEGLFSLSEL